MIRRYIGSPRNWRIKIYLYHWYTESGMIKKKQKSLSISRRITLTLLVLCCILGVFWAAGALLGYFSARDIRDFSIQTITRTIGTEPEKDTAENVNILLIGVWGTGHAGGYLADSIMLASFDTNNTSMSMLSIPRDLYVVEKNRGIQSKINSVFSRGYARGGKSIWSGAVLLKDKVEEIVGMNIPYYAVVDFKGFEKFIDWIGGININIPETIHDTQYPVSEEWDWRYGTFYIQAGLHTLDGSTALKYARSRHSTNDFSRSLRQQQIVSATKDKILAGGISVAKIKKYYALYQDMVTTNFSLQEMLGMFKYISKKDMSIHSFGLNVHCAYSNFTSTDVGCFLYYPPREQFGWAAVILPMGASASRISFYDYIQDFANIVMHHQKSLIENARIKVKNAIDGKFARTNNLNPSGWAGKVAVKLKKYWFNVQEVENADITLNTTTIILPGTWSVNYSWTVESLRRFIPISDVVTSIDTGSTMLEIVLGNDFITQVVHSGFDFNSL